MLLKVGVKCRRNLSFEAGNGTPMPLSPKARGIVDGLRNPHRSPWAAPGGGELPAGRREGISLKKLPLAQISRAHAASESVGLTDTMDK